MLLRGWLAVNGPEGRRRRNELLRCRPSDGDLATHGRCELADDREAQPGPARGDNGVTAPAEEAGEDLLALRLRDARALVVDRELGASAVLGDGDADDGAGRGVLRRVAHEVGHDALHRLQRTSHAEAVDCLVHHLVIGGQVGLFIEDAGHDVAEVQHRLSCHHPCAALQTREVQQVLDQGAEALGTAVDMLRVGARFLGAEAVPAGGKQLRVARDGGDRRPELVGGSRQEHRLQLVHRLHPLQQVPLLGKGLCVRQRRGQDLGGGNQRAQVVFVEVPARDHPEPRHSPPAPGQEQAQRLSGQHLGGQHGGGGDGAGGTPHAKNSRSPSGVGAPNESPRRSRAVASSFVRAGSRSARSRLCWATVANAAVTALASCNRSRSCWRRLDRSARRSSQPAAMTPATRIPRAASHAHPGSGGDVVHSVNVQTWTGPGCSVTSYDGLVRAAVPAGTGSCAVVR